MNTFTATPDDISHDWHVVDAAGVPLGRLASVVAQLIRGKHKPTYTPHMDGGDFVVVVNAAKVRLSGRKLDNKKYFSPHRLHGPRADDRRARSAGQASRPRHREGGVRHAAQDLAGPAEARGKLKVYAGAEHPHAAQQPKPFSVTPSKVSA